MFGWPFEVSAAPGVADCSGGMRGVLCLVNSF